MPAYVIYQGEVLDPVRYEDYKHTTAASLEAAGARYVVRGGDFDVLEATRRRPHRGRRVPEPAGRHRLVPRQPGVHHRAHAIRDGAAHARMYVVDGVD